MDTMKNFSKLYSLRNYIQGRLLGHILFPRSNVGKNIRLGNGNDVQIFRQVIFRKPGIDDTVAALFHVTFHLRGMSPRMNKLFSNLPIPFFVGLPGFCAKLWCLDTSNGDFHGFYKWQSKEHAVEYSNSFAIRFMSKRSVPESIHFEIMGYKKNKYKAFPDIP
jgi:hypothetical protein